MLFDPLELNYSKVKTYNDCPLLYKYIYVEQRRSPLTPDASLGISLHKALGQYHSGGHSFDDLLEAYDSNWIGAGYSDAQQQVLYYKRGNKMLEDYWQFELERKTEVVHVEKIFAFPYQKWTIKGTIDRVDRYPDGSWEIIDYKSGPEIRTEEELAASLQIGVYALGLKQALSIIPAFVTYWFLAYNKKVTIPYSADRDQKVLDEFIRVGELILKEEFAPNNANCPYCAMRPHCLFAV